MSNSVLYLYDGFLNPGDAFSYCGTRFYLNQIIDVIWEQSRTAESTTSIMGNKFLSGPDFIVLAGAPWFWDGCTKSQKYASAYATLKMTPRARKIAIGVGSCYLKEHRLENLESIIKSEGQALISFWSEFDFIAVRDILAWWILSKIGIKATLAPCPSRAVGEWYGRIGFENGLMILGEPLEKNFMFGYLADTDKAFYANRVERLISQGSPLMEWFHTDRTRLPSRSVKSMCQEIESAACGAFFTARVHAALVAVGLGLGGDLQPVDSRALSASLQGVHLVGPQADYWMRLAEQLGADGPPTASIKDAMRLELKEMA